jgi:integrase
LIEIADKGLFEWSGAFTKRDSISIEDESIDALRLQYLESLRSLNLSKNYTELNGYAFRRLISNLGVANTLELYEVQPHQIQSALAKLSKRLNPNSRSTIYPIIRRIISYLYAIGAIQRDFSGMVMTPAYQQSHLRPYLDSTNEQKLNEALKTESFKTKAVISLALCSGLRESDILNLRFSQIDWQNDKIILEQQKSGVKLVLPLIEDVGNAIMDYIISERPPQAKDCEYIFVRSIAPYTKMNSLYNLTYRLFKRAGIKSTNIDRAGMHVLRHTLAYKLLLNKVPHQIITDTLGHVSKESDKPYISMDEQMLRECPLDLSVIGQKYWNEGVIDG